MRPAPDDEFKLRFSVAKDRMLLRISVIRIIIVISIPVSFVIAGIAFHLSRPHDPRWPDNYGEMDLTSPFYSVGLLAALILFLAILSLIVTNIIESTVLTRRYGWRAMSDPIEAQRIAMREALYDVTTGSTRADVEPEREGQGNRIMIVPVRRLRPIGARLELTAEREKERASRETRPTQ